jgi:hypothetical protein
LRWRIAHARFTPRPLFRSRARTNHSWHELHTIRHPAALRIRLTFFSSGISSETGSNMKSSLPDLRESQTICPTGTHLR